MLLKLVCQSLKYMSSPSSSQLKLKGYEWIHYFKSITKMCMAHVLLF